jgi:hypothetical protein
VPSAHIWTEPSQLLPNQSHDFAGLTFWLRAAAPIRTGVFMAAGKSSPGKTLYDLLCARPDDDAEAIQTGFRRAAKSNHPDLNPGDPEAAKRFRQIAAAYAILRDPKQREAYDRLLAFERQQQEAHDKLLASERAQYRAQLRRAVVTSAAAVIAISIGLAGSYTLFAHPTMFAKTDSQDTPSEKLPNLAQIEVVPRPVAPSMSGRTVAVGRSAEIPLVKPTTDSNIHAEPAVKPAQMELAERPVVPAAPTAAAMSDEPFKVASSDSSAITSGVNNDAGGSTASLDPRIVASGDSQLLPSERDASLVKPLSSAKLRAAATKRPAAERPLVRQAAVESKYISQVAVEGRSTPLHPPPLFGVGF